MILRRSSGWFFRRSVLTSVGILCLGTVVGCEKGIRPPKTARVSGVVKWKGLPTAGIVVRFHPLFDMGKVEFIPSGETGPDGKFVLSTGVGGDGAPPGEYSVTFEKPRTESDFENSGIEIEVDEFEGRYKDPNTSTKDVTIESGDNELNPFELD